MKKTTEYTEELYMTDPEMEKEFVDMPYQDEPTVISCEVEKALKETAKSKTEGVDDLQIELLNEAGDKAINSYANFPMPGNMGNKKCGLKSGNTTQKGDLKLCTDCRTIALMSNASKVLFKIEL